MLATMTRKGLEDALLAQRHLPELEREQCFVLLRRLGDVPQSRSGHLIHSFVLLKGKGLLAIHIICVAVHLYFALVAIVAA